MTKNGLLKMAHNFECYKVSCHAKSGFVNTLVKKDSKFSKNVLEHSTMYMFPRNIFSYSYMSKSPKL